MHPIGTYLVTFLLALSAPMTAGAQSMNDRTAADIGEEGIREYETGNLVPGMALLQQAAEQGYVPAQVKIAYIFDKSEQDESAVDWYRRAAEAGEAAGQLGLSGMYARGEGVERDSTEALKLLQSAVAQAYPPALRTLAAALEHGDLGLSTDAGRARQLYQDAANNGDRIAITRLVYANRKGELGLAANAEQAIIWEKKLNE